MVYYEVKRFHVTYNKNKGDKIMTVKRVINEDTGVYFFEFADEKTTSALTVGDRYLVTAVGTSSALSKGLQAGDIFRCTSEITLGEGDKVKPLVMTKFCGFQNIDGTFSKEQSTYEMIQNLHYDNDWTLKKYLHKEWYEDKGYVD